jgi:DNA-binding winged helix-turn-helix (wHTH) protein
MDSRRSSRLRFDGVPAVPIVQPTLSRTVAFGPFTFDRVSQLLRRHGEEIPLPPRVLGVLVLLLQHPGEVVTKQALIASVWRDAFVTETSIAEAVSVLRQTLGDDPQRPTYVQTLHRRGYRFIADVRDASPAAAIPAAPALSNSTEDVDRTAAERGGPEPRLAALVPWLVALFSLLTAAAAVWQYVGTAPPEAPSPVRFTVALPAGVSVATAGAPVAVSDDGSMLAFAGCDAARCAIYLRPLAATDATPVAGTTSGASPFFSPDGRTLGFFSDGELKTIPLGGGGPSSIASAPAPLGAAWLRDDRIVFARSSGEGLFVTTRTGRDVRALTTPARGEGGHRWPAALPDSSAVVFTVAASASDPAGSYGALATLRTGAWGRVLDSVDAVRAPAGDHLVAQRGDGLVATWFDVRSHTVVGLPVPVPAPPLARGPQFAVSRAGTLVATSPDRDALHVVLHWAPELRRLVPPPQPTLPR